MEDAMPVMIYVQPTVEGLPPRALLQTPLGVIACRYEDEKWLADEDEVPEGIAEAITAHALNLGVELP